MGVRVEEESNADSPSCCTCSEGCHPGHWRREDLASQTDCVIGENAVSGENVRDLLIVIAGREELLNSRLAAPS